MRNIFHVCLVVLLINNGRAQDRTTERTDSTTFGQAVTEIETIEVSMVSALNESSVSAVNKTHVQNLVTSKTKKKTGAGPGINSSLVFFDESRLHINYNDNSEEKKSLYFELLGSYLPLYVKFLNDATKAVNDTQCKTHMRYVLNGIQQRRLWALKMMDATAKFPDGFLQDSVYQLGNFDECVNIRINDARHQLFKGQYCLADIDLDLKQGITSEQLVSSELPMQYRNFQMDMPYLKNDIFIGLNHLIREGQRMLRMNKTVLVKERFNINSTLHWAVCVPSTCAPDDVQLFLREFLNMYNKDSNIRIKVRDRMCSYDEHQPFNAAEIIYIVLIVVFVLIVLGCTLMHYMMIKNHENAMTIPEEMVVSFSIIHNTKKVLHMKQTNEFNLDFIGGIRALSMIFIIIGHSLILAIVGPVPSYAFVRETSKSFQYTIFTNSLVLVDTFLLFSGFLMCLIFMKELDKRKGRINFLFLYIGRYIRLTPAYVVVIGFYCTWMIRLNDGPLWNHRIGFERDQCLAGWWANLLYINNYTEYLCMFQSWYLSVDTQLFVVAPFVIYALWKWPYRGQMLLGVCTVVTIAVPIIVTYVNKLDPTLMVYAAELEFLQQNEYFMGAYIKTHMRASSYFIGVMFGYIVYRLQNSKYKFSTFWVYMNWTITCLITPTALFSVVLFYQSESGPDYFMNALYCGTHRVAWCLGIGWLIIACVTDNAGLLNKFLSWKLFQPFARLTYCAYLTNGFVTLYGTAVTREPQNISIYDMFVRTMSHNVLSFSFAFILCIFFESPIHGMERILLRGGKRKSENNNITRNHNEAGNQTQSPSSENHKPV